MNSVYQLAGRVLARFDYAPSRPLSADLFCVGERMHVVYRMDGGERFLAVPIREELLIEFPLEEIIDLVAFEYPEIVYGRNAVRFSGKVAIFDGAGKPVAF